MPAPRNIKARPASSFAQVKTSHCLTYQVRQWKQEWALSVLEESDAQLWISWVFYTAAEGVMHLIFSKALINCSPRSFCPVCNTQAVSTVISLFLSSFLIADASTHRWGSFRQTLRWGEAFQRSISHSWLRLPIDLTKTSMENMVDGRAEET